MVFGFARGVLVIAVVLLLFVMGANGHADWYKHSALIPHFQWLVHWLKEFLPAKVAHFAKETSNVVITKVTS